MNLDPTWLFLSLLTGAIGAALFMYGRRNDRWPQMIVGILFIVYPYFTPSVTWLVAVGVILAVGLWYILRTGR